MPEIAHLLCATTNPMQAIVTETAQERDIMGRIGGMLQTGVKNAEGQEWSKSFLRQIVHKA